MEPKAILKMKKAETEGLSFFIGIIITILILVSMGYIFYQYFFSEAQDTIRSFDKLTEKIENLNPGDKGQMPYFINEKYVLIGFEKEKDYAGVSNDDVRFWNKIGISIETCYGWVFEAAGEITNYQITKPKECDNKGCLCICKIRKEEVDQPADYQGAKETKFFYIHQDTCIEPVKCKSFDDLSFEGGEGCDFAAFIPGKTQSWKWKIPAPKKVEEKRGLDTIFLKREGAIITVDDVGV